MRALIVGAGTMGTWFAEVTDGWLEPVFLDTDPERAAAAAAEFDGTARDGDDRESVSIVCIAVPISATPATIEQYAPLAETAVVDLSGAMGAPNSAMARCVPTCERISLHALFAPENEPGNVAAVTEGAATVWEALRERLEARGNVVFETNAETHDVAMETVQAKVHAAVIAYALAADPIDERFHTPISRELTKLAEAVLSGTPRVYAEIQGAFDGADDLAAAAETIASADHDSFESLYRDVAREFPGRREQDE